MNSIIIREIEEKDNKRVKEIIRSCLIEFGGNKKGTAWDDPNLGCFSEVYKDNKSIFYVAEKDGIVIGCGGIGPLEGQVGVCELQKMYFLEEGRGLGAAKEILDKSLEFAKSHYSKCYLETLTTMKRAQSFYIRNGFNKICSPVGSTGHCSCDTFYIKEL